MWSLEPRDEAFVLGVARRRSSVLAVSLLLLMFRRLGRFVPLEELPPAVVDHVRRRLRVGPLVEPFVDPRTLYRHHRRVRDHLGIEAWGTAARHVAIRAVFDSAQSMNNPADLINLAVEALVRERFELPAFRTLDDLVARVRALVNRQIVTTVAGRLNEDVIAGLDCLLVVPSGATRSPLARLKQPARRLTVGHLDELAGTVEWLESLGDPWPFLDGVRPAKIAQFAAEAWAFRRGRVA